MILMLDTSTPTCRIFLAEGDQSQSYEWEAGRGLSRGLLRFVSESLSESQRTLKDIKGIAVMKGPGSFTGLRIGLSVLNVLAETLQIPIVGESGEGWQEVSLLRLSNGENDQLVMPLYGRPAHITSPKK